MTPLSKCTVGVPGSGVFLHVGAPNISYQVFTFYWQQSKNWFVRYRFFNIIYRCHKILPEKYQLQQKAE